MIDPADLAMIEVNIDRIVKAPPLAGDAIFRLLDEVRRCHKEIQRLEVRLAVAEDSSYWPDE